MREWSDAGWTVGGLRILDGTVGINGRLSL